MSKALLLGIALASNIGGAASPIASPQNLIALQNMSPEPGWGTWFFIALPVCILSILAIWMLLLVTLQPGKGTTIVPIRPMREKFSGVQWFISIVTIATIVLWCVSHQLQPVFGDMGVIAIIPIAFFFGTGILTKEDFNNFLWTIIILAAGGLALGKAVASSGLLHTLAEHITEGVKDFSLYGVTIAFAAIILVAATFISHTVSALIFLPLVQQVGRAMAEPHPNLLVMSSVLMCSAAMGLPTSGFPNMSKSFDMIIQRTIRTELTLFSSGDHDGRLTDRATISAGQTFHYERCTRQYSDFHYRCHSWIRAYAHCGILMQEIFGEENEFRTSHQRQRDQDIDLWSHCVTTSRQNRAEVPSFEATHRFGFEFDLQL